MSRDARAGVAHDGLLRVSGDERQEAVDALIGHWSAGRLDEPTFDDRAARAASAVTRADLRALFVDLPPLHPVPDAIDAAHPGRRSHRGHGRQPGRFPAGLVILLALVIAGSTSLAAGAFIHIPWAAIVVVGALLVSGHRRHHLRRTR